MNFVFQRSSVEYSRIQKQITGLVWFRLWECLVFSTDMSCEGTVIQIGANNTFEVGSQVEAVAIGNANIIEVRARVLPGCIIGNGCVIGANVVLGPRQQLEDNTIVSGPLHARRIDPELFKRNTAEAMPRLSLLKKNLPPVHKLITG